MAKVVNCECGFVGRGETDDELVEVMTEHAKQAHDMDITREQVLAMAQPE